MPQSKLRGCASKVPPKGRARNAKRDPDEQKSFSPRGDRSQKKRCSALKLRRFDCKYLVRSAGKRSAKHRAHPVRAIAFVDLHKHLCRNERYARNRLLRTRRALCSPVEQKRPSQNCPHDGRDDMPPRSTRPHKSRQGDHDIRDHKEEGAFRKPPQESQHQARHPVETIDPARLFPCSACLSVCSDCRINQGCGS